MTTNVLGNVAIVFPAKGSSETIHALDCYESHDSPNSMQKTGCGRDASEWLRGEDQNISTFIQNPYACKRCVEFSMR